MKRVLSSETPSRIGETIEVAGWVAARRDHGKLIFFDLRDRGGLLQVVVTPKQKEAHEAAREIRGEWVVGVQGKLQERPADMKNEDLPTGTVELLAESLHILSQAATPPFSTEGDGYEVNEETRLKYRYVDLRRERLKKNLEARSQVLRFMREFLYERGFVEVETPILTKSTPEGARDFLVPSRLEPGKFYALPQSPQQYKQLLQVAGFERYFQMARALRDEDPRADRQAEHTQLDLEMSFVKREDVMELLESLYTKLVSELFPKKKLAASPFPILTYKEAMEKHGTDRPDLRKNKGDGNELAFCFVVDFPAFARSKDGKKWEAEHNPFSGLQAKDSEEVKKHPEKVLSWQYDLALNGHEVGGGSIRSSNPEMLRASFGVMGYTREETERQFGHMLEAFTYGVPPHGGYGGGIERLLAILLGESNIREVMAFPKTGDNRELMMGTPSEVSQEQLDELHLKIQKPKAK